MSGFSPLDLLSLSEHEQDVMRYVLNHPAASLGDVAACLQEPQAQIEQILQHLVQSSRLTESYQDGQRRFAVRFSCDKQRVRNRQSLSDVP